MIGFFDSGFGGLTVLKKVVKALPDYSYVYLGDNARTPYGSRSAETIYNYTCEGIEALFSRGAQIVILACNTSSAVALRRIQQEYLPQFHPDKKVLGIIIPTAEEMKGVDSVGILATEATVESAVYPVEIAKHSPCASVVQQACPLLVPIIEAGELDQLDSVVHRYVSELFLKNGNVETVILGCTHYAIIEDLFRRHVPEKVQIVSQGAIVAEKLKKYLEKHPEVENKLQKGRQGIFLTTEHSKHVRQLAEMFYGGKINLEIIKL